MVKLLFAHPRQAAIAAIIYMNDDLMSVGRILLNAAHTELEQFKVVPSRNQYRKHGKYQTDKGEGQARFYCTKRLAGALVETVIMRQPAYNAVSYTHLTLP